MSKGARERLNETLEYLRTVRMVPWMNAACVAMTHSFAVHFVNRHFAATPWYSYNGPMRVFSEHLSLGSAYMGDESNAERKRLRAIFLLRSAIRDAGNQDFSNHPAPRTYAGNTEKLLLDEMWRAAVLEGQRTLVAQAHTDLLAYMKLFTVPFLLGNRLFFYGHAGVPAGDRNVQAFVLQYNAAQDRERYEFIPAGVAAFILPGAVPLQMVSVKAVNWNDVSNRGADPLASPRPFSGLSRIRATELGGATIMATTQFQGCSFCFKADAGGRLYVAHISPGGRGSGLTGNELAYQLCGERLRVAGGDFLNVEAWTPFWVYGRGHGNIRGHEAGYPERGEMFLLAFDDGPGWRIYAQWRNAAQITGVKRIHPAS